MPELAARVDSLLHVTQAFVLKINMRKSTNKGTALGETAQYFGLSALLQLPLIFYNLPIDMHRILQALLLQ